MHGGGVLGLVFCELVVSPLLAAVLGVIVTTVAYCLVLRDCCVLVVKGCMRCLVVL
jgi:hypothetical protein